jgi:hypothetical protein
MFRLFFAIIIEYKARIKVKSKKEKIKRVVVLGSKMKVKVKKRFWGGKKPFLFFTFYF